MTRAPVLRVALGAVASSPVAAPVVDRLLRSRINVVYAHDVGPVAPHTAAFYTGLDVDRFRRDLRLLQTRFEFAPLRDVVHGDVQRRNGRPLIALTFDDGFDLIRTGALDVLADAGIPATTFLITSCVDNRDLMWRNKLSAVLATVDERSCLEAYARVARAADLPPLQRANDLLRASVGWPAQDANALATRLWEEAGMEPLPEYLARHRPYFTSAGIEDWLAAGNGVGLHTRTHPRCSLLDDEGVAAEIVHPAAEIRRQFGCEWLPFSYPFGDRLSVETERQLLADGTVECAFGIRGFARSGTPPGRLERACLDADLRLNVFGRSLLNR